MITLLHTQYRKLALIKDAKANDLEEILKDIKNHWPNVTSEGSTGYIRSYYDRETKLMVGYAWCPSPRGLGKWNYLIFKEPQEW